MYSGAPAATVGTQDPGVATVTRPAPDRRAPTPARHAAPVFPRDPATINTCPQSPLWAPGGRAGMRRRMPAGVSSSSRGPSTSLMTPAGIPISATTSSPARASAGGSTSGIFGAPRATVTAACTAGPSGRWLSADRPLGRSTETIGAGAAFTSSTTARSMPSNGLPSPVPNTASTITSYAAISDPCSAHEALSGTARTRAPMRPRMSRLVRASPRTASGAASRKTVGSTPRPRSRRATTKPSPPLLPRPHSTATRRAPRSSKADSIASTIRCPACSISTIDGIPISSIVRRSTSRICAASSTRIHSSLVH